MFHYFCNLYLFINGIWLAVNKRVIGNKPHTLKFTQKTSDCVSTTIALSTAAKIKKPIHRILSFFHPSSCKFKALLKKIFNKGLSVKYFKFSEILYSGLASSVCFFIITNFGAWLTHGEMYAKNFSGLMQSYVMAIPFFQNTLISTFVYLLLFKLLLDLVVKKKIFKISF